MTGRLKGVFLWLVIIAAVFIALQWLSKWYSLQELQAWSQSNLLVSFLIYSGVLLLIAALCLPGSGPLTVLAGAIFGFWWGLLLVSFVTALGATVAMLVTRKWFQGWVRNHFSGFSQTVLNRLDREGEWYLFSVRLVPAIPFFLVNLTFGLSEIKTWRFYWVTQLGMLAGVAVYVNAGTQLQSLDYSSWSSALNTSIVLSLFLLAVFPWLARWGVSRYLAFQRAD